MNILKIVREWKYEENGDLTLEDVAEKPLRKLSVARAFADLLALAKMRYVVLYPADDLQIKCIKAGRKLSNQ